MKNERFPDPLAAAFRMDWRLLTVLFLAMAFAGGMTFWYGISGPNAGRAWQAYLINFLFWSGLANGAVLFAAALNITKARWGRPIKRLAEAPGAFLPVSVVLFGILYLGRESIFPWIHEPVEGKEWWLDVRLLFVRDGLGILLLAVVSMALIYYSLKGDRKISPGQPEWEEAKIAAAADTGEQNAVSRSWQAQVVLSPIFALLYTIVLSLLAVDLIMSLDPHWVSTLFGAYYFISSLYIALAAIMLLAIFSMNTEGLKEFVHPRHMHDLGKLLLGFCLLTGDFFYSQFLVIWYGNLPEEARYVLLRVKVMPWQALAWTVLIACFVGPFVVLLSRKVKTKRAAMIALAGAILAGMWLERLLLVAPSLWKGTGLPFGIVEIGITAGFVGLMGLCLMLFFHSVPLLPTSDPLFWKYVEMPRAEGDI